MEENKKISLGFRNILFLGLTSFFTDFSTEMVAPLVTIYLSTITTVTVIGVVEGITESLTSILKSYSGYIGDRFEQKKKLAFLGYFSTVIYKILLFFSYTWIGVFIAKVVDRIGKGIRTAPRDALISQSGEKQLGKSFGFHKMMDMLGSAVGIVASILLLNLFVDPSTHQLDQKGFQWIFLISMIPSIIGAMIVLLVHEQKNLHPDHKRFSLKELHLSPSIIFYFVIIFLFSIGNSSNAFLVLKVKEIGFTTLDILLLYLVYNLVSSFFSYPLGLLADKIERRWIVLVSYIIYAISYFAMATTNSIIGLYFIFAFYGIYQSIIAGSEKSYLASKSEKSMRGTVFGIYGTIQGIGILIASLVASWLWTHVSVESTFIFGSIMALISAIFIVIHIKKYPL